MSLLILTENHAKGDVIVSEYYRLIIFVELASVIVSSLNSISLLLRLEMHLCDHLWMRRLWLHLWFLMVWFLYILMRLKCLCGYVDGASICGILMFRCEMIGRFSMVLPYVLNTIIIKSLGKLLFFFFLFFIELIYSILSLRN